MRLPRPRSSALAALTADGRLLFATRCVRMFAYGFLAVVLTLYLAAIGLDESSIGQLLTFTLLGDTVVSLLLTTSADRLGRRKVLIIGAILMIAASGWFATTTNFWFLLIAATVGVISPSGYDVGPFLSIEQAALAQTVPDRYRTSVFAWYNLIGSLSTACGSLAGGAVAQYLKDTGYSGGDIYRPVVLAYGVLGLLLIVLFARMSPATEATRTHMVSTELSKLFGLHRSRGTVMRLAALFSLDAFGGGFVIQAILVYWFHERFGVEPAVLGSIFFGANLLAAVSALAAGWLAQRVGLLNTMVFTHLPSNVLLMMVPLMPNLPLAIAVLLARFSISQMDVPARQSYTMAVVPAEERAAAAGVTGVARSLGASLSPILWSQLAARTTWTGAPFFLAGGIKIIYDLLLYRAFVSVKPPEERTTGEVRRTKD